MSELAAKRWAKALMELACEDEGISKEDILDDLREVAECFASSDELSNVVNNPSVSSEEKQIVLSKLFQSELMPIVYNFLFALNLRKRLSLVADIAKEFENELEIKNNIVRVDITSAIDLDEAKKNDIKNKISEKLQKDIKVNWGIDADIIAGLIFNINDTVIDNSVKHKLNTLSKMIVKA